MKEEQPRLLVQHVAMNGRHLDAVRPQGIDNGVHLTAGKNKIPGDRRLAAAGRLKVDCCRDTHRPHGGNLHSALGDWVAAWDAKLINATVGLAFDTNDLVELRGVEIDRGWSSGYGGGRRQRGLACPERVTNDG